MAKNSDKSMKKLPLGAIKPTGWLLDEMKLLGNLQRRLSALHSNLREEDLTGSESFARYARGSVLLSAALDDKTMYEKISACFKPLLSSAREGGDFGREGGPVAAKIEAVKALFTLYEYSGNERILPFLRRFFKYQFNTLRLTPIWYDSRARLLEEIPALEALYRQSDLEWLMDLAELLRDTSNDWFRLAVKFPYKKAAKRYVTQSQLKRIKKTVLSYETADEAKLEKLKPLTKDFVLKQWKKQIPAVELSGVNIAKAIKYPATYGGLVGDNDLKELSAKLYNFLMKYHGTATGAFTCDPLLKGNSPVKGVDVAAACEALESLVEVIRNTADMKMADALERVTYNLVAGAVFADGSAVEDSMLVNQTRASAEKAGDYECEYRNAFITKKFSKGAIALLSAFPTFMQALCFTREDELDFMTYAPCEIDVNVGGARLVISEKTGYPFRNTVVFKVEKASGEPQVKINFRVPKNCTMQLISGGQVVAAGNKEISVKCSLRTGSTFTLKMDIPLSVEDNPDGTVSLFKGNVLMSLKLPADVRVSDKDRRLYDLQFMKKWNVAPILSRRTVTGKRTLAEAEQILPHDFTPTPFNFDVPPFELKVRAKNVVNWETDEDGVPSLPRRPQFSEESLERTFIPFGCSLLHIAQFPKCVR